jgi:outer membrane lipoprotein-sorting protein
MRRNFWDVLAMVLALLGLVFTIGYVCGCADAKSAKEAAAEGAYLAEHMKCVQTYDTNDEINTCRDEVRRRWGIVTTVRDAGGDR